MKNLFFLGVLLCFLAACEQSVQPDEVTAVTGRVASGATITGLLKITKATVDTSHCKPSSCQIVATKLAINKIVNYDSVGVSYRDTIWEETTTRLTVTSSFEQPFKFTEVPTGYYRIAFNTTPCGLNYTFNRVKVAESTTVNLGTIFF